MNVAKTLLEHSTLKGKPFSVRRAALPKRLRQNKSELKSSEHSKPTKATETQDVDPPLDSAVVSSAKTALEAVAPYAKYAILILFRILFDKSPI